ncbi:MAG: large conductance mechanosensitive channel protein MscL [Clostridia bacterium]|nr:large conductance mechanosensitive channel protein MscL [Clostridia bacterium]
MQMKKFFKEFKAFISKGNVFDMAVGLIIATAFNKIVSSLVNDILMPVITWATGASSLAELSVVLRETVDADGTVTQLTWKYGNFLQTVLDFLIIAISVFIMVKIVNSSTAKFKELEKLVASELKAERKDDRKLVKKLAKEQKRPYKEVWVEFEEERKRQLEEKAKLEAEEKAKIEAEEKLKNPTEQELLKQILETLKENKADKN